MAGALLLPKTAGQPARGTVAQHVSFLGNERLVQSAVASRAQETSRKTGALGEGRGG